jgi:hypothetical protein
LAAATLEERLQLLTMMLDSVHVDMAQGLVLVLEPKPEFLRLFNLNEPVTTGDLELVAGRLDSTLARHQLTSYHRQLTETNSVAWLVKAA